MKVKNRNGVSFDRIQAIPIRNMHYTPYPVSGSEGQSILEVLNGVSHASVGESAVLF